MEPLHAMLVARRRYANRKLPQPNRRTRSTTPRSRLGTYRKIHHQHHGRYRPARNPTALVRRLFVRQSQSALDRTARRNRHGLRLRTRPASLRLARDLVLRTPRRVDPGVLRYSLQKPNDRPWHRNGELRRIHVPLSASPHPGYLARPTTRFLRNTRTTSHRRRLPPLSVSPHRSDEPHPSRHRLKENRKTLRSKTCPCPPRALLR